MVEIPAEKDTRHSKIRCILDPFLRGQSDSGPSAAPSEGTDAEGFDRAPRPVQVAGAIPGRSGPGGEDMAAVWSMTSQESGRFSPVEKRSDLSDLTREFNELRSHGRGYLEIRMPDSVFPQLTLSFSDDLAVIHLFTDESSVSLLTGDGVSPTEVTVDVPVMDDLVTFTGNFVLGVDHAWEVVQNFTQTQRIEELGEWCEL
ncbi:hypothetical protein ABZ178_18405 [Streptomyces massasporeus]|uniref:hypothetical protein n=1 Tax=Streptomyces massasporeus TaxID=67324 RepID=UPI0033AFBFBB